MSSWPLLQSAIAGTVAWQMAAHVVGHHQPFFAPIAAVVALNQSIGERGVNAVRLLVGVVVGIVAGEAAMAAVGEPAVTLPVATFAAMAVARALDPARIVTAQAAAGAIPTVTAAGGEVGPQRLVDALIGAGVALVFSQILFSPEPIALVRRAEASTLARIADGLECAARALARCDDELAADAVSDLRAVRDDLAEVSRATRASSRVTRRTLLWRSRRAPVVRENENAAHLDLLAGSCLMLARAAREVSRSERRRLAPSVRALTDAIAGMSSDPGDRDARERAVDQALAATRSVPVIRGQSESMLAAVVAVRMVAADVLVFAGVDPRQVPLDGALGVPRQDH